MLNAYPLYFPPDQRRGRPRNRNRNNENPSGINAAAAKPRGCDNVLSGSYQTEFCYQGETEGYAQYGFVLEIPSGEDCSAAGDSLCSFEYTGSSLQCSGTLTYTGSCGDGCIQFSANSTTTCQRIQGPDFFCREQPAEQRCEELPEGVYYTPNCAQSNSSGGYGFRLELPPDKTACSSQDDGCNFSYPGLRCFGFVTFGGTCGKDCYRFYEQYIVTTGCLTRGDPTFTLELEEDGEYTMTWTHSTSPVTAICENLRGPELLCFEG